MLIWLFKITCFKKNDKKAKLSWVQTDCLCSQVLKVRSQKYFQWPYQLQHSSAVLMKWKCSPFKKSRRWGLCMHFFPSTKPPAPSQALKCLVRREPGKQKLFYRHVHIHFIPGSICSLPGLLSEPCPPHPPPNPTSCFCCCSLWQHIYGCSLDATCHEKQTHILSSLLYPPWKNVITFVFENATDLRVCLLWKLSLWKWSWARQLTLGEHGSEKRDHTEARRNKTNRLDICWSVINKAC